MKNNFFMNIDKDYERTTLNIFINLPSSLKYSSNVLVNRSFNSADMFPTALAAIGCSIEGDRLGLGTNLFTGTKTIFEQYGYEYVNNEFKKRSTFYENVFSG